MCGRYNVIPSAEAFVDAFDIVDGLDMLPDRPRYNIAPSGSISEVVGSLLRNAEARGYLHTRQAEIEEARRVEIAFDRDRYMATLERLLQVTSQQYVGEDGRPHIENPGEARRIAKDLYAVETGNVFPFQQYNGVRVSINIDTQWRGYPGAEPIDVTEAPDEPPEYEEEPPRAVIIGRK